MASILVSVVFYASVDSALISTNGKFLQATAFDRSTTEQWRTHDSYNQNMVTPMFVEYGDDKDVRLT
jgi:hypothetical protein